MELKHLKPGDTVFRELDEASPLLYERHVEVVCSEENVSASVLW